MLLFVLLLMRMNSLPYENLFLHFNDECEHIFCLTMLLLQMRASSHSLFSPRPLYAIACSIVLCEEVYAEREKHYSREDFEQINVDC